MNIQHSHTVDLNEPTWFCLRSLPKHEHIAAMHLRRIGDSVEVFCPKLRIRRQTRRGAVWFVEALFPGYLFAKFRLGESMALVKATAGVKTVVTFGTWIPHIREDVIAGLRNQFDDRETHEINETVEAGDEISIACGPFQGMTAKVLKVQTATQRVQILLEMLGRCTQVEVSTDQVVPQKPSCRFLAA